MIKLGLIARADISRGLGQQTYSFFTHLSPHKTLVIDMGERAIYNQRFDLYTSTLHQKAASQDRNSVRISRWNMDGSLPDRDIKWLLSDTDVIFTAETFYDPRIITYARAKSIPTIVQPNWEFAYWNLTSEPRPTLFAWPSQWMQDFWPENSIYLPFPIDTSVPQRVRTSASHLLHVAGHPTRADRDGSKIICELIPYLRGDITFTITSQSAEFPNPYSRNFTLNVVKQDIPDLTDFYYNSDLFILPRRFGGQSLKLNEAMATGAIPIMPDCPPQSYFLPTECLISGIPDHALRTQGGNVRLFRVAPRHIASRIESFRKNPTLVEKASQSILSYISTMDWQALLPLYTEMLEGIVK